MKRKVYLCVNNFNLHTTKDYKYEKLIGLWASETHFLIIRNNLIEYCIKGKSTEIIEYPRVRHNLDSISISDTISIYMLTDSEDEIHFKIGDQVVKMNRMN